MVAIGVLFEAKGLAVEAALHVALLALEPFQLGVMLLPRTGGGACRFHAKEPQPVRAEDALREEVEHRSRILMPST